MLHLKHRHPVYPSVIPTFVGTQPTCARRDEELDPRRLRGDDENVESKILTTLTVPDDSKREPSGITP